MGNILAINVTFKLPYRKVFVLTRSPHQIFTMSSSSTSMSGELSLSQQARSQQQSVFSFMSLESEIDRLQCVNAQLIEENMRHRKLNMPDVDLELDLLAAEIERLRRENKQLKQENDDLRFLTRTDTEITDESRFLQECMNVAHRNWGMTPESATGVPGDSTLRGGS